MSPISKIIFVVLWLETHDTQIKYFIHSLNNIDWAACVFFAMNTSIMGYRYSIRHFTPESACRTYRNLENAFKSAQISQKSYRTAKTGRLRMFGVESLEVKSQVLRFRAILDESYS